MSKHKKDAPEKSATPADGEAAAALEENRPPQPEAPADAAGEVLAEKDAAIRELQAQLLYLRAEQENFKKRTEKRYREMLDYAAEPLLKDLVPVLDNLERAAAHAREGGPEGFAALLEGLGHVVSQFSDTLARHGAELVPTEGARFDPEVHDAVAQVPGENDGMVGDVFEKGYRFKARLLRPAKVTVTKVAPGSGDG